MTRKAGSSPISLKLLRRRVLQKLSIVVICAWCSRISCFWRWRFPGSSISFFEIAFPILSRIWAAAALVNVTTSSRSMSSGFSGSEIMRTILSTRTAVLPLPAAADTRIL